jgi:hypothetical protein
VYPDNIGDFEDAFEPYTIFTYIASAIVESSLRAASYSAYGGNIPFAKPNFVAIDPQSPISIRDVQRRRLNIIGIVVGVLD